MDAESMTPESICSKDLRIQISLLRDKPSLSHCLLEVPTQHPDPQLELNLIQPKVLPFPQTCPSCICYLELNTLKLSSSPPPFFIFHINWSKFNF